MRTQKELATYRGHNRDVTCAAWHPHHEELFASGGYDGSLIYWLVSDPNPQVHQATPCAYCTKQGAKIVMVWVVGGRGGGGGGC